MPQKYAGSFIILEQEDTPGGGTYTEVAYLTDNSMTWAKALINVNNKTDGTYRCNIVGGEEAVSFTVEGWLNDDPAMSKLFTTFKSVEQGANFRFHWKTPSAATVMTVDAFCHIANMDMGAPDKEGATFSSTFESSGVVTASVLTPAP